jgi:uncharacterized protein (TIGR03086 family)
MDPVPALQRVIEEARRMIGSVRPYERNRATPCAGWDVTALTYHMIGICARFTAAMQEATPGRSGSIPDPNLDLALAYREITDTMLQEWGAPGALEKTVSVGFGTVPASTGIIVLIADQMLHTWDLARTLERQYTMPENIAADVFAWMQTTLKPEFRGPGKAFGPEVPCPEDAPLQDRLVAFAGRQP